jgi:hypothetical protein
MGVEVEVAKVEAEVVVVEVYVEAKKVPLSTTWCGPFIPFLTCITIIDTIILTNYIYI